MKKSRILLSNLIIASLAVGCDEDDPNTTPGDDTDITSDQTSWGPTGTTTTTTTTITTTTGQTGTTTTPGGNTGATGVDTDTSAPTDDAGETLDAGATGSSTEGVSTDFADAGVWVDAGSGDAGPTPADAGAFIELSDGEILQVFWTANAGEVAQGEIAFEKAASPEVMDFAELMVTSHTSAQARVDIVAMEEDIALAPNAVATALQVSSEAVILALEAAPTDSEVFDLLYMRGQVAQHESVLEMLRDQLIPQADNEELVTLLAQAEDDVAAHLSVAQSLVVELESED